MRVGISTLFFFVAGMFNQLVVFFCILEACSIGVWLWSLA